MASTKVEFAYLTAMELLEHVYNDECNIGIDPEMARRTPRCVTGAMETNTAGCRSYELDRNADIVTLIKCGCRDIVIVTDMIKS